MQNQGTAVTELQQALSNVNEFSRRHPNQPANPHAVAHANLQALRDSGDTSFLFGRAVLELATKSLSAPLSPQEEELLFHSVTGCRHVVLTTWNSRSVLFRNGLRDYFMALGMFQLTQATTAQTQATSSRTIRLAYLNASASFWKRTWVEDLGHTTGGSSSALTSPQEQALLEAIRHQSPPHLQMTSFSSPTELIGHMDQLMQQLQPELVAAASTFLSILLGEFAGKSASEYHMPLEFHKQAHASFGVQNQHPGVDGVKGTSPLDVCLMLSMRCMGQLVVPNLLQEHRQQYFAVSLPVVQLTIDIIGWDWEAEAWDGSSSRSANANSSNRFILKPPTAWRESLLHPDFLQAIFQVHSQLVSTTNPTSNDQEQLAHALRQLLLQLLSISGPIFRNAEERKQFCELSTKGVVQLLSIPEIVSPPLDSGNPNATLLMDSLAMAQRLFGNYKLQTLFQIQQPLLQQIVSMVAAVGKKLLRDQFEDLQHAAGDVDLMLNGDWREEAIAVLVDALVFLCDDPWLMHGATEQVRLEARMSLARDLGSLYGDFVSCRSQMARLEEMYVTELEADLDEVRESIYASSLEEEMTSIASVGRLDLGGTLTCLAGFFPRLGQLASAWENPSATVTPEIAGLLEESRLLIVYLGHLLTDDNEGETATIPDAVLVACDGPQGEAVTQSITGAVSSFFQFAQTQATKIAANPNDPRLSPLLAQAFLWLLRRWAPAYIAPVDYAHSRSPSSILKAWSSPEVVQEAVSFLTTLCLHYHCCWPQEPQVQDHTAKLLQALTKHSKQMRLTLVGSSGFQQLLTFHCLTAGVRHSAPEEEVRNTVIAKAGNAPISFELLRGYQRLPYVTKSSILTALLVGCSEYDDETSRHRFDDCLKATHDAFASLVHVLSTKQASPDNVDTQEMACLCVELYGGVARSGEMVASERVPNFITPSLPHLSGLMSFYANDLSICESLLRLFCDYAEQFIAVLDTKHSIALFQASGELLRSYSSVHCASSRVIAHSAEEEQNYNDILCAMQLLIQLGTKDFIDVGSDDAMDSSQVTDMIFFGLQQILPLMTRGLLQYPTFCTHYFSLVGFMMETYPEKVGVLPYELFDSLLESLLFGMSHHDAEVAKSSLQGLAGIIKEHIKNPAVLGVHLSKNAELLDKCTQRVLLEVVFQHIVFDRLEASGLVVLHLALADMNRFVSVLQRISQQVPPEQVTRLMKAFEDLLHPDVLTKAGGGGFEGRQNRIRFKKDFDNFCKDVHSFLVMK
eukprot:Nitzschia sp. Nitz4//scaffold6_size259037//233728//237577//NITZ4_001123-RA/size259037-augustus-gene-0.308-mRNA-1//1//CDS//3329557040//2797//frame0